MIKLLIQNIKLRWNEYISHNEYDDTKLIYKLLGLIK